jgi:glutathione reductase (NADPH)
MAERFDYDLFVIGAGSGGVRAARVAGGHGARVAIAEEYRVGGTCVIRGCVPKKLLVYASRFRDEFEDARGFGWMVGAPTFDWRTLIANKDKEIARLEAAYKSTLARNKVELFQSRAMVTGPQSLQLADGRRVRAETILIATGGTPHRETSFPGHEHTITSNEAFHLSEQPERILIAGGGYIAVEFAGIFNGLGSKTTLIYRGNKILRGFDEDVRDDLTAAMRARGIEIVTDTVIASIEKRASGLHVSLKSGATLEVDQVMMAVGRRPNTEGLGLETAGVPRGKRGEVVVDAASRTSVPSVFAVGDVTDRVQLTPVAIREGHAFADSRYGNRPWTTDHETIPTAVFSTPEVGTVGLSEADARAKFGAVDIYKTRFRPMANVIAGRDERMLMKLVVDAASQRVLGCHILGPDAAEIVQMAAIPMKMGATKADFDRTMALHPSAAEELVTMRDKWVPPATG